MDLLFLKPFLHFLRIRGLNYTVREYYRILHLLNLKGDWGLEKFRQVLKKVLVKNKDHALIFTQCFEDFFNTGIQTDADTKKDIEHNADIPVILNEVKDYNRKARKNPVLSLFTHSDNKEKNTEFSNISFPRILSKPKIILSLLLVFIIIIVAIILFFFTRLPVPELSIEPEIITFTPDKKEEQIIIKNSSLYKAIIEDISLDPEPEKDIFILSGPDEKADYTKELIHIKQNESKSFSLSFKGDVGMEYSASLVIKSNTKESPQVIPIQIIQPAEIPAEPLDDRLPEIPAEPPDDQQPYRIYKNVATITDYNKEETKLPNLRIVWSGISAALLFLITGYVLYLYFRKIKTPPFDINGPTHFSVKNLGGIVEPRLDKQTLDHISDAVGYFLSEKESKKINETASIDQTCKKGFPIIRYHFKKQVRKVIILEDRFAQARIWNPIARELVKGLKNRGVPVLHGFFKGIPDEFVLADNYTYRIEDIEDNKNGCILLLFSDSKGLYHQNNSFIMEQLSSWDFVAWMELRDRKFWDESITRVMEHGIQVYPASKQGILDVLDSFTTELGGIPLPGTIDELLSGKKIKGYHNLPLYIEELLGDSLNWAEDCALMQPLPFGLADALRRRHNLDHDRIERLFMLPGTTRNAEGIRFSPEVCAILKTLFYRRRSEKEREEVLSFILTEMDKRKPTSKSGIKTLKEIDWKWQREKIHFELAPGKALSEIKELARFPIKTVIELEMEKKKTELSEKSGPPVKTRTQNKLDAVIRSIKRPELKVHHYITVGALFVALLFFAILGIRDFLVNRPLSEIEFVTTNKDADTLIHTWLYGRGVSGDSLLSKYEPELPLSLPNIYNDYYFNVLSLGRRYINEDYYVSVFSQGQRSDLYIDIDKPARWTVTIDYLEQVRKEREEWDNTREIRKIYCPDTADKEDHIWVSWQERFKGIVNDVQTDRVIVSTTVPVETIKQTETRVSIGIEILFNESNQDRFKEIQNLLLDTGSVDVIYSLGSTEEQVGEQLAKLKEKLEEEYGPFLAYSQFIVWSDNTDWYLPQDWNYPFTGIISSKQGWQQEYEKLIRYGGSAIIAIPSTDSARPVLLFKAAPPPAAPVPDYMVKVEGGSFTMGSESGDSNEKPVHTVKLDSFYISRYEVTQEQYLEFCNSTDTHYPEWLEAGNEYNINTGTNDWYKEFAGPGKEIHPIAGISWYDATAYCNWLSQQEGLAPCYNGSGDSITCDFKANGYRLPTEAEWEYASRGGLKSKGYTYSGSNNADEVAWYYDNSRNTTHTIGGKSPNELGLYDMSGNVWEWCWDWYGPYTAEVHPNPRGPEKGEYRVLRGGSWIYDAGSTRSAYRDGYGPSNRDDDVGFRLARGL